MKVVVIVLSLIALYLTSAAAFHSACNRMVSLNRMAASLSMSLTITSKDMELTDPIRKKIDDKINKVLNTLGSGMIISSNIVLKLNKHKKEEVHSKTTKKDSQIVEATIHMVGGSVLHSVERTGDIYASITLIAHNLAKKLKKHKQIMNDKRGINRVGDNFSTTLDDFDEEELLDDTLLAEYKPSKNKFSQLFDNKVDIQSIKSKSFEMQPMTTEEAAQALLFIDHDFYIFRNIDTLEINVVYKKADSVGGIGHIQPK